MRASTVRSVLALLAACGLSTAAEADIFVYGVSRYMTFAQTSNAPPTDPLAWGFSAVVYSDIEFEIQAGSVWFERPPITAFELSLAHPNLGQYYSPFYEDEALFLADYPATTYTLAVDRGGGFETGDVDLASDLYCPEIPYFTGNTYSRLQNINTSVDFVGGINGFTLAPGTDVGYTTLVIAEDGVGGVLSLNLEPEDTAFQIPAGTLLPNRSYSISVGYTNAIQFVNAGFGFATSDAQFSRSTTAYFSTTDGTCPADLDGNGVLNIFDFLAFQTAFSGQDPIADFDGNGVYNIFDFLAFQTAFGNGC